MDFHFYSRGKQFIGGAQQRPTPAPNYFYSRDKQFIGGAQQRPTPAPNYTNNDGAHNDAVEFFHRSHGSFLLFTQLELSLSASNLPDRDITSKKSDGKLEELGRTEVILNSLSPAWIEKVGVAYQLEIVQPLIFHVYDVDTKYHNAPVKTLNLKDQEFLGEGNCVLSEIVTKQSRSLTLNVHNRNGHGGLRNLGTLTVHAEETFASRSAVEIKFRCSKLENKDLFSKSDPFLRISRIVETGGFVPICKTEVVDNNLNPIWKPLCLHMQLFGSKDNPFLIECFDFNRSGNHVLIGKLQKSVADLEKLYKERRGVNFVIPSSHRDCEKVLKGQLFVDQFCEKEQFSFLDYISSGFDPNFMVSVDFKASNGNPRSPNSLHYINPYGCLNSFQQSDLMVAFCAKKLDDELEELGRTEVILNTLSPPWIEKDGVAYQFEIVQPHRFHVYAVDTKYHNVPVKTVNLKNQEFHGEGNCVLSEKSTASDEAGSLGLDSRTSFLGSSSIEDHFPQPNDSKTGSLVSSSNHKRPTITECFVPLLDSSPVPSKPPIISAVPPSIVDCFGVKLHESNTGSNGPPVPPVTSKSLIISAVPPSIVDCFGVKVHESNTGSNGPPVPVQSSAESNKFHPH